MQHKPRISQISKQVNLCHEIAKAQKKRKSANKGKPACRQAGVLKNSRSGTKKLAIQVT
jgi:hypothetical protein